MKKTNALILVVFVFLVFCIITVAGDAKIESKTILDKVEQARLEKSPAWVLHRIQEHRTGIVTSSYKWTLETNYAEIAISVLVSASEAQEHFNQTRSRIPTEVKTIGDLGDEAFVSQSKPQSSCMVVVRKTNIVFQVNASDLSQGEKWSRLVVEQISQSPTSK